MTSDRKKATSRVVDLMEPSLLDMGSGSNQVRRTWWENALLN
ncbi:MAG: hypothetical protein Ct9H300mP19_11650 [Dehalococcoidia bacterium]|nr:MAG: hypothetical protein Ct9H300mP19_11650 [Dehalococcoidia bacterium]